MKKLNLVQGSPEWSAHRATAFNASDAPAMLGISPYKSRSALIKERATGITPDVDDATQARFNDGHRFEELARILAEGIIGDDLSPIVGAEGKLSASFDGATFDGSIIFEHKTLNDALRGIKSMDDLPDQYLAQIEQQLMVSGADKCLFMASRWNADDTLAEEVHIWVISNQAMRERIMHGWVQFAIDVENYQHVEHIPAAVAAPTRDLPALSIQVQGSISLIDNLSVFGAQLNEFVAQINKEPTDDQGFADAEAAVKTLQAAQDALEAAEASALAQTSSIDEMRRTVKLYADTARTTRLMLEKMVKARKESIRIEIITKANADYASYIAALESEIKPLRLIVPNIDTAGAIKNKRTIASLHESMDTVLRNGKMEADAVAKDFRAKRMWISGERKEYEFLFHDLQQIIIKPMDDFKLLIETRIAQHKQAEAAKMEAERTHIQAQEEAKAKAAQDALLAAERAKMEAEVRAKAESDRIAAEVSALSAERIAASVRGQEAAAIEEKRKQAQLASQAKPFNNPQLVPAIKPSRPSRNELINIVADAREVDQITAREWLEAEFQMIKVAA